MSTILQQLVCLKKILFETERRTQEEVELCPKCYRSDDILELGKKEINQSIEDTSYINMEVFSDPMTGAAVYYKRKLSMRQVITMFEVHLTCRYCGNDWTKNDYKYRITET